MSGTRDLAGNTLDNPQTDHSHYISMVQECSLTRYLSSEIVFFSRDGVDAFRRQELSAGVPHCLTNARPR